MRIQEAVRTVNLHRKGRPHDGFDFEEAAYELADYVLFLINIKGDLPKPKKGNTTEDF